VNVPEIQPRMHWRAILLKERHLACLF
jgi:hypothetical protein